MVELMGRNLTMFAETRRGGAAPQDGLGPPVRARRVTLRAAVLEAQNRMHHKIWHRRAARAGTGDRATQETFRTLCRNARVRD